MTQKLRLTDDLVKRIIKKTYQELGFPTDDVFDTELTDLDIYYDKERTGCYVNFEDSLLNMEINQTEVAVAKENEFSNGLQYCMSFKIKELNDEHENLC